VLPDIIVNPFKPNGEVGKSMMDFDWGGDEEKPTHDIPFCHPGTRVTPHNSGHFLEPSRTRCWVCWRTAGFGVLKTSGAIAPVSMRRSE
jgi:hypothetical protein